MEHEKCPYCQHDAWEHGVWLKVIDETHAWCSYCGAYFDGNEWQKPRKDKTRKDKTPDLFKED